MSRPQINWAIGTFCGGVLLLGLFVFAHRMLVGGPLLSVDDPEAIEGDLGTSVLRFTVRLATPGSRTVTVKYQTDIGIPPNGADPGVDYEPTSGWLTFYPGEIEKTVDVVIRADTDPEGHETLFLNLSRATYAIIDDSQGEGLILNDDGAIVWVEDTEVIEADGKAVIEVLMDSVISSPITVEYETRAVTALADSDYRSTKGTVTFLPNGGDTQTFLVPIIPDTDIEQNETFEIIFKPSPNVEMAANEEIGQNVITVTILNDDGLTVSVDAGEPVQRSPTETVKMFFTVRLSQPHDHDLLVDYQLVPGKVSYYGPRPTPLDVEPAVIGDDVIAEGDGHLLIPAGQTTAQIVVCVPPKRRPKGSIIFYAEISNPRNADSSAVEATIPTGPEKPAQSSITNSVAPE